MRITAGFLIASAIGLSACVPEAEDGVEGSVPVIDGTYDLDAAQCGDQGSLTRMRVRGDSFGFYESSCVFGRKGGQPGAAEGTLMCMSEGRRFSRAIRLDSQQDGLGLIENGRRLDYHRCPD